MTTATGLESGEPTSADEDFRSELRSWLSEHTPPGFEVAATPEEAATLRDWQRTLHAGRWVGIHWPVEYGGRGASVDRRSRSTTRSSRAPARRRCSGGRA